MNHRRSETAIVTEILRVALKKPGITSLMYSTNLNHRTVGRYCDELHKKGLIEIIDQPPQKRFQTTQRGKEILGHLEEALQLLHQ